MVLVTPCRSDMSPAGLAPHAHLCDGRIQIILVKHCSQINYLRFLAAIPKTGPSLHCTCSPANNVVFIQNVVHIVDSQVI